MRQREGRPRVLRSNGIALLGWTTRLLLILFLVATSTPPAACEGGDVDNSPTPSDSTVRSFACRGHIHGVEFADANALGPGAIPHLRRILADEAMKACWANTICVVSAIGSADSYEILRGFVWDRFKGDVDEPTFRALEAAVATIGFTCPGQPDRVMTYLEHGANPERWKNLPWRYPDEQADVTREKLGRFCIHGLSYCAEPRAQAILKALLEKPYGKRHGEDIREALEVQKRVMAVGLREYEREASKR